MALRIPPRHTASPNRALAARSPGGSPAAPSFYNDTGIYVANPAAHSIWSGRRARTPPATRREVAWSGFPTSDDDDGLDGTAVIAPGPTLGAVRDMIRGMAGRMAALGSSNAAFKQQSAARQSPTRSRSGGLGLVAGLRRGAATSSDDDDDVRDTGKRHDPAFVPGVPQSLLRAQQAQRMQPVSPRKPTGSGTPGKTVQEGGCKAVQAQLRVLSASYKQLRQRGAV